MPSPRLSVVVPAFNEGAVLEAHLQLLVEFLARRGEEFEILCVDDGSSDDTAAILNRLGPRVRTLVHRENLGKGAAVRTGSLAATGERVVFLDADLSTELSDLEPLLAALDAGADVALGSRRVGGAGIEVRQPATREFLGRCFSGIARALVAPEVLDFTCGFKGFRREAAHQIFSCARVNRWAFDAEIIAIARARGLRIVQVPVRWRHCAGSKVHVFGAASGALAALGMIVGRRLLGSYRR